VGVKALLSGAALAATLSLFAAPYPFDLESVWVIPVCVSTILSLWLALTSRFLAAFALACLTGIVYAFSLQAFEVRYLYRFPLKDGSMFQSGAYYAYRSILRNREWIPFAIAISGIAYLAALNIMTLSGRFHHRSAALADGLRTPFMHAVATTMAVGALLGLFMGWSRYHVGFVTGIQGMLSGLGLGLLAGRFLKGAPARVWTVRRREILLATGLCTFLFFELIAVGLCQRSFAPHLWISSLLSGDIHEYVLGYRRYQWHAYLFRPGPLGWVLFNLLDIVFMLFFTLITLFNRVGHVLPGDSTDT